MCLVSKFSQVGCQAVPWGLPGQSWLRISIYEYSIKIQAWIMINVWLTRTSTDIFHIPLPNTHQSWEGQYEISVLELWLPAVMQCRFFMLDDKKKCFLLCGHHELCNVLTCPFPHFLRVGVFVSVKCHGCFCTTLEVKLLKEMCGLWSDGNYCNFVLVTFNVWGKCKKIFGVEKFLK